MMKSHEKRNHVKCRKEANMRTINEVSQLSGVSIRTLHYYDTIGLLLPTQVTEAGYRLYDDIALEQLQQILLFRELQFPLKEIKSILESRNFDRNKALEQQIELLILQKEHLENLITFAREIKAIGANTMDFSAFDTSKIDEYAAQAKKQWGKTEAYHEFEQKSKNRNEADMKQINQNLMEVFVEFGHMTHLDPSASEVQAQVKKLQDFITNNYYTCTIEILAGLGTMYGNGGDFTENINKAAGDGTAEFAEKAIETYCSKNK